MTDPNWHRVSELYYAALEKDRSERARFLSDACPGDDELRREVESLLGFEELDFAMLDRPQVLWADLARDPSRSTGRPFLESGSLLGSYRVKERHGAGGMGEVYRADDLKLSREVALKVLPDRLGDAPGNSDQLAQEARVLALMNHPNIGAIYGLEESDSVRALVLELVDG